MKIIDDRNSKFSRVMTKYYAFKPLRIFVIFSTFICQLMLVLYLMVIPIQLAYHSELNSPQNKKIQDIIDMVVCAFFTYHILLYFDNNIQKIIKSPNSLPKYRIDKLGKWTRLLTLQILYDLITWGISVFMSSPQQNTFQQRILQLFFFLKIYKLYKFHKRIIYVLIGTTGYPIYKIVFTILATFTMISYLSSIFYAIDYAIYLYGGPLDYLIWLTGNSYEPNLIQKPFWTQLLMINYWAMGTSSTAAYGDICGQSPQQVVWNIFVLFFANFLYGYYLTNIHSIPKQAKQQQIKVLEKFDQFQKYTALSREGLKNNKQSISAQLYLKILCSIQYKQSQRRAQQRIQTAIPGKYIQQIKLQMYSQFFNAEHYKPYYMRKFFSKQQSLLKLAKIIQESVCQKDQNIYLYDEIHKTDLIYIHEGSLKIQLPRELKNIVSLTKVSGQMFGEYSFITGQFQQVKAIALEYLSVYRIKRQDYKKCLSIQQFLTFDNMFYRCLQLSEQNIEQEPYKKYNQILEQKQSILNFNTPHGKQKIVQKVLIKLTQKNRSHIIRNQSKGKKIYVSSNKTGKKKTSVATQTQSNDYNWKIDFDRFLGF